MAAAIAAANLAVAFARPEAAGLERTIGWAGVVVAPGIGWFLAHRVLRPGIRVVLVFTSLEFALLAVLLGSIVSAVFFVSTSGSAIGVQALGEVVRWAILGLLLAGLPMFGLTFALALAWGTVVRGLARLVLRKEGVQGTATNLTS